MSCSSIESDTESPWCNKAWHLAAGSRPWRRARRGVRCSFDKPVVTITSSRGSYQAVSCEYSDGMRSDEVGIKLSGAFQCPFAIGCLKPSHAGFPARHHVVGQTTSLHCFYFRTRTERDCGSHLSATERPPVDVPFWRVPWKSPLLSHTTCFARLVCPRV